jgi:phospholipase C
MRASRAAASDRIEHVVVLMLENRSFDQALGALQPELAAQGVHIDGIDPTGEPRSNFLQSGPAIQQLPLDAAHVPAALTMPDPMHELANVQLQLGDNNSYFALDYAVKYPIRNEAQRELLTRQYELVMRYYPPGWLSATHELARHFTICDHWFASVPGPTWTNRFFVHSGTSIGRVHMPEGILDLKHLHLYDQDTIYDRLDERGVPWRIYYGDVPHSLILTHQWQWKNKKRYRPFGEFATDARGPADEFPAYVFIEPSYMGDDANDDHPPHDVLRGQQLIADVYNALRSNRELFNSTLFVLLYDEHGGFYDHVVPPEAVPPDQFDFEYDFKRLGIRIPALLISPWVDHAALSTPFDHTSLLKYLIDKWGLGPLGARTANANSFAAAIRSNGAARDDVPQQLRAVAPPALATRAMRERLTPPAPNSNQAALLLFSEQLDSLPSQPPPRTRGVRGPAQPRAMRARAATATGRQEAKRRVERFLETPTTRGRR